MRRPVYFLGLLAIVCSGCGGSATDTRSKGDSSSRNPPDEELTGDVELLVAHVPVDDSSFFLTLSGDAESGPLASDAPTEVRLAFGEEYASTIRFVVGASLVVPEGSILFGSNLVIDTVTVEGDGINVTPVSDDELELLVREAGAHRLTVEGRAAFVQGDAVRPFTGEVLVDARQVGGAEWDPCSFEQYFVSGAPLGRWRVYALDEEGRPFEPSNATVGRPADVIIKAKGDTTITATGGMESVVITGPSQTIHLFSNHGEMQTFELIQPSEIDSLDPTFYFDQGGTRGGGTGVRSGGEIELDLSLSPYISVHPGARYQGTPLCGGPDPHDLVLRSTTPEVCIIQENGCAERGCATEVHVRSIAEVVSEGVCTLELEAPSFNGGEGLSTSYTVEVHSI